MRATVLQGRLEIYDVKDVEGLAGRVLEERLREWRAWHFFDPNTARGAELRQDALSFLISTAWELSRDFDPGRGQAFSTYAYRRLRLRFVDWFRRTFGDARYAPRPEMLSIEPALETFKDDDPEAARRGNSLDGRIRELLTDDEDTAAIALANLGLSVTWEALSPHAIATKRRIAEPLAAGDTLEEIARRLNKTRRQCEAALEDLRDELLTVAPDLPEWLA